MTSVLRWPAVERVPAAHDTDMPCCWGSIVHTTKVTAGTGGRNVSINKWALNHSVNVLDALAGNTTEGGGRGGEGRGWRRTLHSAVTYNSLCNFTVVERRSSRAACGTGFQGRLR